MFKYLSSIIILLLLTLGCKEQGASDDKLQVVTTTTMITDLVNQIGGDVITVQGLMGSGVDPHLYKASEGDVGKLYDADVIFYNGLHLEGKLVEIFEKMDERGKTTVAVSDALDKSGLIGSEYFASNYDPHVWFDSDYWAKIAQYVAQKLAEIDPENAAIYEENYSNYLVELDKLQDHVENKVQELPQEKRILVTAHDAFNYFGRQYRFEVVGLQGLSTATEAGVQDVRNLTDFIIKNEIKAIFIESSVPRRTVEALQAAVKARNFEVEIGGELYSDALGNPDSPEGTYIGMYKYNINTIVNALK